MDPLDIPEGEEFEIVDFNVPDITSSDPEERKAARRIRIRKRLINQQKQALLAQQRADGEGPTEEAKVEKPTLLSLQLEKSSEILRQLFSECEEQVTNIRVANDSREVDRREDEGLLREEILKHLDEEADLAKDLFNEIADKWAGIMAYNDPLHISDAIQGQKDRCDELVKQKDGVIEMLKHEVKMAEHKFYKDQRIQNEDISTLAKRVEIQVATMRLAHRRELQNILDVMIEERALMTEMNDKHWEELYKKREEQELAISQNKLQQLDEFEDVVSKVRTKHYELLRAVKIKMERDCEALQEEFEHIKAAAMFNSETMDYNYQILKKREEENLIIKSNQKRKINKLQDTINNLRSKLHDYQTSTELEISKLFNEIINLQKCIDGVRKKSSSLAVSNEKRYMELWEMNFNAATKILNKLLTIDRLLHEQQLGVEWIEPEVKVLRREELPSFVTARKTLQSISEDPKRNVTMKMKELELDFSPAYRRTIRTMLDLVTKKTNFLLESRLKKILEMRNEDESLLVTLDNVFCGLGITEKEQIDIMYEYFRPYVTCEICSTARTDLERRTASGRSMDQVDSEATSIEQSETEEFNPLQAVRETDEKVDYILNDVIEPYRLAKEPEAEEPTGECLGPPKASSDKAPAKVSIIDEGKSIHLDENQICSAFHPVKIDPAYVLKALREFITSTFCTVNEAKAMQATVLSRKTMTVSRLMDPDDVRRFWEQFRNIIGEGKVELWDALWFGMQRYHDVLEERHKLNKKICCLRHQNMELKHLLQKYRDDKKP